VRSLAHAGRRHHEIDGARTAPPAIHQRGNGGEMIGLERVPNTHDGADTGSRENVEQQGGGIVLGSSSPDGSLVESLW